MQSTRVLLVSRIAKNSENLFYSFVSCERSSKLARRRLFKAWIWSPKCTRTLQAKGPLKRDTPRQHPVKQWGNPNSKFTQPLFFLVLLSLLLFLLLFYGCPRLKVSDPPTHSQNMLVFSIAPLKKHITVDLKKTYLIRSL